MKIPVLVALVFAVSLITTPADTTTQTWDAVASCAAQLDGFPQPCFAQANINAVLTTQMESGTFYDPYGNGDVFTGIEPVVTGMTGTFDGMQMTLLPVSDGDWILNSYPINISFLAGGHEYDIWWDGFFFLQQDGLPIQQYMNWNAVDPVNPTNVPETGGLLFPLTALDLFLMFYYFKRPPVR